MGKEHCSCYYGWPLSLIWRPGYDLKKSLTKREFAPVKDLLVSNLECFLNNTLNLLQLRIFKEVEIIIKKNLKKEDLWGSKVKKEKQTEIDNVFLSELPKGIEVERWAQVNGNIMTQGISIRGHWNPAPFCLSGELFVQLRILCHVLPPHKPQNKRYNVLWN